MNQDLFKQMDAADAAWMAYGPEDFGIQVAEDFDAYPLEYAAMRRSVGLFHAPFRGLLELTGADRQDFLHRLLTQDINGLQGGHGKRAFVLNVKGRIMADVIVHHGDLSTWVETDVFDVDALAQMMDDRLFGEDVQIKNLTPSHENHAGSRTCFYAIGPAAVALLQQAADVVPDHVKQGIAPGTHHVVAVAGVTLTAARFDEGSVLALRLWVPVDGAAAVYAKLLDAMGFVAQAQAAALAEGEQAADHAEMRRQGLRGRPVGWAAYNTLRIEEKRPLFHIDFGPDSIPNETGLMDETISFTAGCYPGQEVVCRIKDLGHPKRLICAVAFEAAPAPGSEAQAADANEGPLPGAGLPLMVDGKAFGGVSSATLSPMAGQKPIGLASIKWGKHRAGTTLTCPTPEGDCLAVVQGV